jgi:glycosyltransferase involved in cell wall biosynthesis
MGEIREYYDVGWVTVVIPCKNEEKYIGSLLSDLNGLYYPTDVKLKVIIADAGSTDGTMRVINMCKYVFDNLDIEVIEGGSVSYGRNRGFELVKTPYVIFIDADVQLYNPYVLSNAVKELVNGKRLVTCKLKDYSGYPMSEFVFWLYNHIHKLLIKKYPFAIGAFFAISSSDFKKFGMFNEKSDNSEDFLFSQNFKPDEFAVLGDYIGQDDRRFRKMGYFGMGIHLLKNLIRYMFNGRTEFTKKSNYWS